MPSTDPIIEAEERLKKSKQVQKAIKEEIHYLEGIQENLRHDSEQDEIQKIRHNLK